MDYDEKVECVRAGLGYEPSAGEITFWLYGQAGKAMSEVEQIAFVERHLKGSPNEWRVKTFRLICRIPRGYLISYGELANWARKEYGLKIGPLNAAWLRKRVYALIQHDTEIPIHRVATQNDVKSTLDEKVTQEFNRRKREAEGSLRASRWFVP